MQLYTDGGSWHEGCSLCGVNWLGTKYIADNDLAMRISKTPPTKLARPLSKTLFTYLFRPIYKALAKLISKPHPKLAKPISKPPNVDHNSVI